LEQHYADGTVLIFTAPPPREKKEKKRKLADTHKQESVVKRIAALPAQKSTVITIPLPKSDEIGDRRQNSSLQTQNLPPNVKQENIGAETVAALRIQLTELTAHLTSLTAMMDSHAQRNK